nr:DNA repair protein RecN [Eubacterium sp.]
MLANLHVKNFAIIDEIDVDFGKHLNILTGETGAGKSILVGSIGIALGARVSSEMIGNRGDHAMVELVFQIDDDETLVALRELDIEPEDGQVVVSRKITENRSINKINGESVPVSVIKKVSALCMDIHGQHEHQSLIHKEYHMEVLDKYAGSEATELKEQIAEKCREYHGLLREMNQESSSAEERARELSFLEYEKKEIEEAKLRPGEEEELEEQVRKLANASTIVESLSRVYELTGDQLNGSASGVSQALRQISDVAELDEQLVSMQSELMDIENLLADFNRGVSEYMQDFSFDESELRQMEERLDLIRNCQSKYGKTYEDIMAHLQEITEKIERFSDYEEFLRTCEEKKKVMENELTEICGQLTNLRKEAATKLERSITEALEDLNFEKARFQICIEPLAEFSSKGKDDVEFLIATNPGAELYPLGKVASGGELSRVMLAIKTVFADVDSIETLIFDEIDVGISGRTAQKVSEKMSILGTDHQIICITHLAQIAAMADTHFVIEKISSEEETRTNIRPLSVEESEEELARILGGVEITEAVLANAKEMKSLANKQKQYL